MPVYDELIEELNKKRLAFESEEYRAPSSRDIKRWNELLGGNDASRSVLSSGRQSIRRRAQDLATSILQKLGPEVLLLVVSLLDMQKMSKLNRPTVVRELQIWWSGVSHPQALTTVARECFAMHVLDAAIAPTPQIPTDVAPTGEHALAAFGMILLLLP